MFLSLLGVNMDKDKLISSKLVIPVDNKMGLFCEAMYSIKSFVKFSPDEILNMGTFNF